MGSRRITHRAVVAAVTALVMPVLLPGAACKRNTVTSPAAIARKVNPWDEAVARVEQDRGEAAGRKATVDVPPQLKHYADRRRFLAVQAADSRTQINTSAHDFAGLVLLHQRGQFYEMKPLGAEYILYGVGESAGSEPFAHFDRLSLKDIPLAATERDFEDEIRRATDSVKEGRERLAYLEVERRRTAKRDRARRATLFAEVAQARRSLAAATATSKLLGDYYRDRDRREGILAEYQLLSGLARDFEGEAYDLNDADARRRLKIRLLSLIRPEARDVLLQIAHDYKEKFDRPLPVSSLVRPEQYQHELRKTNANAARGPTPPHATGLAFDIYYRYMSAAEQEYLMSTIARLKDQGRVEALRESRDNIHVYVFAGGRPPDEKIIARVIAGDKSRRPARKARAVSRR